MKKSRMVGTWLLITTLLVIVLLSSPKNSAAQMRLFPTNLPGKQWIEFPAAGFSKPACGVIYKTKDIVTCGMPLGGVDVGCIDLETSGLLGYSTIFNTHVPRGGPLNLPILGLSTGGKTWVLCVKRPKQFRKSDPQPLFDVPAEVQLDGVQTADEIHYWGHYPVADLEFETTAPVQVGLRAWSPFFPGNAVDSMIPAIVFELRLRNGDKSPQSGTIAFSFPGPHPKEAGAERFCRKQLDGELSGVEVAGKWCSYAIGVICAEKSRVGGGLGADGAAWGKIGFMLPEAAEDHPGASAAVDFSLLPGEEKVVRFVLAWHAPTWNGAGYNWATALHGDQKGSIQTFSHMYAKHYPCAAETARLMARRHVELLRRVLAWQEVIYTESALPVWLRESLVNILHLVAEDGMWAQAKAPIPAWVKEKDGLFGMNECPRECPQIECIPCSFYGNVPIVYFFPELALSALRGYKGYQDEGGAPPWIWGGCTDNTPAIDFTLPTRGYQVTMNGPCYVDMLDRYLLCHGNQKIADEFYASMKKAVLFTLDLNRGPDGVVSMPDRKVSTIHFETEWFEFIRWSGIVPHVGGVHLAMLRMAQRLAEQSGDREFAEQCGKWIEAGQNTLETKTWTGKDYLTLLDEKAGKSCDLIFGYQLDGEWMARWHGLPGVFRPQRVDITLDTIAQHNVAATKYGAVNFAQLDKKTPPTDNSFFVSFYQPYDFYPPEVMMLGMTYMYNNRGDLGLELVHRCMKLIVCEQCRTWDMPNIIRGDTGKWAFGSDYYQNMMLWALPAAMENKSLEAPTRPGGLVDRIIAAANPAGDKPESLRGNVIGGGG